MPSIPRPPKPTWRREPTYRAAIAFGLSLFAVLRIKFRVRGDEHFPAQGAAILAITHFGYLDFALTERCFWKSRRRLMRFMATAGSFRHKISGPLMRGMHHIPVDRAAGEKSFQPALDALARGEVVGIFPEAGVSTSWTVRKLKTGTVRLAASSGAPIIPIAVWGGHRIITRGHGPSLRRAFGTPIHIEVGAAISVAPDDDVPAATTQLHDALDALVERAQDGYPVPSSDAPLWWMPAHLGGGAPEPDPR